MTLGKVVSVVKSNTDNCALHSPRTSPCPQVFLSQKSSVSSRLGINSRFQVPVQGVDDIVDVRVEVEVVEQSDALRVSPVPYESGLLMSPQLRRTCRRFSTREFSACRNL